MLNVFGGEMYLNHEHNIMDKRGAKVACWPMTNAQKGNLAVLGELTLVWLT